MSKFAEAGLLYKKALDMYQRLDKRPWWESIMLENRALLERDIKNHSAAEALMRHARELRGSYGHQDR
jgi:hypothetical protein